MDLIKYLTSVRETTDYRTGEVKLNGYLKNISIQTNENGYSFIGSLTKAKLNHNFAGITYSQTREIIESISDNLHYNFSDGTLYRIDFGNCFSITEKPEFYFPTLGYLNAYLERSIKKRSSLYYGYDNSRRSLIFYDKMKDYRDNRRQIPVEYQNGNHLRYEIKLKKLDTLKRKCGLNSIKVSDLLRPNIFNHLLDNWKQLYLDIQKEPKGIINMSGQNLTYKNVQDLALIEYIKSRGGLSDFLEWIDLETKRNNIKKGNYKKYIKDRAKKVSTAKLSIENDRLVKELDSKISETVEKYRI